MPYIPQDKREGLRPHSHRTVTPGELNFQITSVIIDYLKDNGLSYRVINDIVGALESAKAEFQRRIVAPYENEKMLDHGDVYLPIREYLR